MKNKRHTRGNALPPQKKSPINRVLPHIMIILLLLRIPFKHGFIDWSVFNGVFWGGRERKTSMLVSFIAVTVLGIAKDIWRFNKPYAVFTVLCVFSVFYPVFRGFTVELICVLVGAVWYLWWVRSDIDPRNGICIACLINMVMILMQQCGFDPLGIYRPVGFFTGVNFSSMFLAVCLPAFFRKKWIYFVPLFIPCLIFTKTSGSIAALFIAGIFTVMSCRKNDLFKAGIGIVLLISVFAWSYIDMPSVSRLDDWKVFSRLSAEDVKHRSIFYKIEKNNTSRQPYNFSIIGYGIGGFKYALISYNNNWYSHMHNEYLESVHEIGLIVIPLYVWFFLRVLKRIKKNINTSAAIIIISIVSMFNYPIHNPTIAAVSLIWLAMFDRRHNETT
jgi:hypothetical protein